MNLIHDFTPSETEPDVCECGITRDLHQAHQVGVGLGLLIGRGLDASGDHRP